MVVAEGVGGDVADWGFGEVGWEWGARGEEEFVGAAGVFYARPEVVGGSEAEKGFGEVAVFFAAVGEGAGAAPEEGGGEVGGGFGGHGHCRGRVML